MAFMLAHLKVPLSWREILRRTFDEAFFKDNCLGMAAQLAYYFFFALFPALLVVLVVASYFTSDPEFVNNMFLLLRGLVPDEGLGIITAQLLKIRENQAGLLTIGMLTALWSSSAAMTAIIDTLNSAYDIEEGRAWWRVRITAILLTVSVALFIVVSFALVLAGPALADRLAEWFGLGTAFTWGWKILQWPIIFVLVSTGIALVYYFAPGCRTGLDLADSGIGRRNGVVAARIARVQVLRQHARIVRELWRRRRRDGADALVLHLGARHPDRCGVECRDRARLTVRKGCRRKSTRAEAQDRHRRDARLAPPSQP
jgi:YihY family inner membrane protein